MSELIRWDTPFTENKFPSISLFIQNKEMETDLISVVVAPNGIDEYPKYLVQFGEVVKYSCYEEAFSEEGEIDKAKLIDKNACAYIWENSPSIISYTSGLPFIVGGKAKKLFHYVIFGGDNIIEVVTPNKPVIEKINSQETITIKYRV